MLSKTFVFGLLLQVILSHGCQLTQPKNARLFNARPTAEPFKITVSVAVPSESNIDAILNLREGKLTPVSPDDVSFEHLISQDAEDRQFSTWQDYIGLFADKSFGLVLQGQAVLSASFEGLLPASAVPANRFYVSRKFKTLYVFYLETALPNATEPTDPNGVATIVVVVPLSGGAPFTSRLRVAGGEYAFDTWPVRQLRADENEQLLRVPLDPERSCSEATYLYFDDGGVYEVHPHLLLHNTTYVDRRVKALIEFAHTGGSVVLHFYAEGLSIAYAYNQTDIGRYLALLRQMREQAFKPLRPALPAEPAESAGWAEELAAVGTFGSTPAVTVGTASTGTTGTASTGTTGTASTGTTGTTTTGSTGTTSTGTTGTTSTGTTGSSGSSGTSGTTGSHGSSGSTGTSGTTGSLGSTGTTGTVGSTGSTGSSGSIFGGNVFAESKPAVTRSAGSRDPSAPLPLVHAAASHSKPSFFESALDTVKGWFRAKPTHMVVHAAEALEMSGAATPSPSASPSKPARPRPNTASPAGSGGVIPKTSTGSTGTTGTVGSSGSSGSTGSTGSTGSMKRVVDGSAEFPSDWLLSDYDNQPSDIKGHVVWHRTHPGSHTHWTDVFGRQEPTSYDPIDAVLRDPSNGEVLKAIHDNVHRHEAYLAGFNANIFVGALAVMSLLLALVYRLARRQARVAASWLRNRVAILGSFRTPGAIGSGRGVSGAVPRGSHQRRERASAGISRTRPRDHTV